MNDPLLELEEKTVFKFFGETKLTCRHEDYSHYVSDDYSISANQFADQILFSVDLNSCFNKDSQCPIHFVVSLYEPMSRRKEKRIFEALNFLKRNEKKAGHFLGEMQGFDDLSGSVRTAFYKQQ